MKLLADRNSILQEILEIEDQISLMRRDNTYLLIKRNLRYLEELRWGAQTVSIPYPDDLEKNVELRSNSKEIKGILLRYRERKTEFEAQLNKLHSQRAKLEKNLFYKAPGGAHKP